MNIRTYPLLAALSVLLLAATQSSHPSKGDAAFVQTALRGNATEVQHAQLQANSSDYRVRQYTGRITTDHQIANQQLTALANSEGIDTSAAMSQPQPEITGNIYQKPNAPASGEPASTASQYFRNEVAVHRQAIKLYQKEASSGADPRLRAYAKQQLPILKAHLQMAQAYLKQEQQQHH